MTEIEIPATRCGIVSLLGLPNAGKSTLLNACVGTKIAAVSRKPQTTRTPVLGIRMEGSAQILFQDTPGVHRTEGLPAMNRAMDQVSWSRAAEADAICYLIDVTAPIKPEDEDNVARLAGMGKPLYVAFTKWDALRLEMAESNRRIAMSALRAKFTETGLTQQPRWIEVSAKRIESVRAFCAGVAGALPPGPYLYPETDLTDRGEKFLCGELIREQLFRLLGQELPYTSAVQVERIERKLSKVHVDARIIVEREGQKAIAVGRGGAKIREIGIAARQGLETYFEQPVNLALRVVVEKGWTQNHASLSRLTGLPSLVELGL